MRSIAALVSAAFLAVSSAVAVAPSVAVAQQYTNYGKDPCQLERSRSADRGAVAGALLGALTGGAVASRKNRGEGALLGAVVGGIAGHQIGRSQVRCAPYPPQVEARRNCRWVYEGHDGFEICPGRDGIWRPSIRG